MTAELAVIVPTRGRPENAARLETAFERTTRSGAVPVFVADEDDPKLDDYRARLDAGDIRRLVISPFTGGKGLCYPLNTTARRYVKAYDYVGFMGDDHLPVTEGWDTEMTGELDSLEPRIAYGNDLLQGPNLPTAVFMQSRMVRALGFMAPQVMRHLYLDNFWKELGEAVGGLRYRGDVVIEHLHPVAGKAEWDERYRVVNEQAADTHDRDAWLAFRADGRFDRCVKIVNREYGR